MDCMECPYRSSHSWPKATWSSLPSAVHAWSNAARPNRHVEQDLFAPRPTWNTPAAGLGHPHLPARDCPNHQEWLLAAGDRLRQRAIRRLKRQILLAGEVPQKRTPLMGDVVADR